MTVAELVERLKQFRPDQRVVLLSGDVDPSSPGLCRADDVGRVDGEGEPQCTIDSANGFSLEASKRLSTDWFAEAARIGWSYPLEDEG